MCGQEECNYPFISADHFYQAQHVQVAQKHAIGAQYLSIPAAPWPSFSRNDWVSFDGWHALVMMLYALQFTPVRHLR